MPLVSFYKQPKLTYIRPSMISWTSGMENPSRESEALEVGVGVGFVFKKPEKVISESFYIDEKCKKMHMLNQILKAHIET